MTIPSANLDHFLRAVHRRLRILRFAEHVGMGIVISAAFATALVGLLAWRSAPTLIPSLCCLGLGILGGSAWGIARRPTRLDAAVEADRQLGLSDLLGSALLVREAAAIDPWAASVIATADARCAGMSASRILLHRLGLRAWGGIGLATALMLTIALLAGNPPDSRAENITNQPAPSANSNTPVRPQHPLLDLTIPGSSGRMIPREDVQDEISNRNGENSVPKPDESSAKNSETRENDADSRVGSAESPNGIGGGAARTEAAHPLTPTPSAHAAAGEASNAAGRATAGVGNPDSDRPSSGDKIASGVNAASSAAAKRVAPWESDQWQSDVSRAQQAINSGQIPPAYQDLVRDYFDRNP